MWLLISNHFSLNPGAMSMYTRTEQAAQPTCASCGRKLGIGYYYTCHICSNSYCYAHAPAKCGHVKPKGATQRATITR
jgi:hypothetical protein